MLSNVCVTMQALIQVSAPGRNYSEAVQWNACMGDLQSAAAGLDTAVGTVVEAAAEHDLPPPNRPRLLSRCRRCAGCVCVHLGVAASKGSLQIWTVLASRRHPVFLPCQHWALGHCYPAAVSLPLLLYCGLRLALLSARPLQSLRWRCSSSTTPAWGNRQKTACRWC